MSATRRGNPRNSSDWIPLADGGGVIQRQLASAGEGGGPGAGPAIPAGSPGE